MPCAVCSRVQAKWPSGEVALVPHWVGLPTHRWHATIVTGRQTGFVDVMARARVYFDGTHMVMARFEMGYQLAHCYFSCTKAILNGWRSTILRQILAHHIQRHVFFRVPFFPGGLDRRSTLQRTRSGWERFGRGFTGPNYGPKGILITATTWGYKPASYKCLGL